LQKCKKRWRPTNSDENRLRHAGGRAILTAAGFEPAPGELSLTVADDEKTIVCPTEMAKLQVASPHPSARMYSSGV
jgi:hypothetical protein